MTRFARAKGSKADNSKTAEAASKWHELKGSLVPQGSEKNSISELPVSPNKPSKPVKKQSKSVWAEIDVERTKPRKKIKCEATLEANVDSPVSGDSFAFAGSKKKRCFNCRKTGHAVKDCPQIEGDSETVCYNCGSTEHNVSKCKKKRNRDKPFEFATCFICKEQGHLSSSCPDNPNGLYPNGGGCKLCGEVTHLYKSCPKYLAKAEKRALTVDTISRDIEGLEYVKPVEKPPVKKVKVVKF